VCEEQIKGVFEEVCEEQIKGVFWEGDEEAGAMAS